MPKDSYEKPWFPYDFLWFPIIFLWFAYEFSMINQLLSERVPEKVSGKGCQKGFPEMWERVPEKDVRALWCKNGFPERVSGKGVRELFKQALRIIIQN